MFKILFLRQHNKNYFTFEITQFSHYCNVNEILRITVTEFGGHAYFS